MSAESVKPTQIIGDCQLYLADCMDVLPTLAKVDAVITDPPYGIDFKYAGYIDSRENLRGLIGNIIPWAESYATRCLVLCGITQVHEYPAPDWIACITWDTTGSFGKCGYTQWMPALFYGQDCAGFGNVEGRVTKSDLFRLTGGGGVGFARMEKIDHPCPKPLNIMGWCVSRFSLAKEVVADPFMGSGTTGVACVQMGRKFIGIEREPKYFDIACRRIEDAYKQGVLIPHEAPKFEQEPLI